jgi:hypothetical protein
MKSELITCVTVRLPSTPTCHYAMTGGKRRLTETPNTSLPFLCVLRVLRARYDPREKLPSS